MEEQDYGMFDDDAEEVEKPKRERRKMKVDREGSKKNKKAKGFIRRTLKKLVIGGIVLSVAFAAFSLHKNARDEETGLVQSTHGNSYMAVYTLQDQDPDTYYLDDYYVYSENGTNYLVRFDKNIDGAYSVLDDAVIEGVSRRDDGVTPLEGTQLLEDIVSSSTIEENTKGLGVGVNKYSVYADGMQIASCLNDSNCINEISGYDVDGVTYDKADDYIAAVYSSREVSNSK